MRTPNPNVLGVLALSVLLGACEAPVKKAEIRPQYKEVQLCHSSKNIEELTNKLLTHAAIRDKKLFPNSEITVFLIEDVHRNPFQAPDQESDSILPIQKDVYYTLSELNKLYCLEFVGHEGINVAITDLRADAGYNSNRTRILNQYGHMEESHLVEKLVSEGVGGGEVYSLLNLDHKAFVVDNYSPKEITIVSNGLKIAEEAKTYVRKKYKVPQKAVIDSKMVGYQNKIAAIECELYELFLQRGFDTGHNIIDLAKELNVTKVAVLYGAVHTSELQTVLSNSQVSHVVLRPNSVGFVPRLDQVFAHCMKSQTNKVDQLPKALQKDPTKWYRRAAEQGDAKAQFNLGIMYKKGQGVPQDYAEAIRWYRKAAEQGHAGAQTALGIMHKNGVGVPQDYAEALRWFEKGTVGGSVACANCLAWLLATCPDEEIRDGERAIAIAKEVVAKEASPGRLDTLAAAYAAAGRFDDAIRIQEQAIAELRKEASNDDVDSGYLDRLQTYQSGEPWLKP